MTTDVFAGLNPSQRTAVEAVRGPVCILAGAGSGKTTTITRRIAHQVASGAFSPDAILAVTFTDRAAGEMRDRLAALGVAGLRARTFHSAALAQLRHLGDGAVPRILPSKVIALRQLANSLPKPYRFRPAADLATEVEWAKNRRITAEAYERSVGDHDPPIPQDLMARIYRRYEEGKRARGLIDFEDLLELTIRLFDDDPTVYERFSARYRAFTVDEYQDVNLLQETLLRAWLGDRDELCVVGDDYQSIYGFTGASPRYLLDMPVRFRDAVVIRLETNYRSTPEVLAVANHLVPRLEGAEKILRPDRPPGPPPTIRGFRTRQAELEFLVAQLRALQAEGIAWEDVAILYRVNFHSEDFEEALTAARIPYRVADGAFLQRATGRMMLARLRGSRAIEVAVTVRRIADDAGFIEEPPDDLGDQELTRQKDLARFVALAEELDDGIRTVADAVEDIERRFGDGGSGRGVNLLTYHRAKGLEFEAVFLPRVEDGDLPWRRARTDDAIAEERRLFYVGITRAKTHLAITWATEGRRTASAFVGEIVESRREDSATTAADPALLTDLKTWRRQRASRDGVPAYVVFHDATLADIADRRPTSRDDLAAIAGIGPAKLDRYGDDVLEVVRAGAAVSS